MAFMQRALSLARRAVSSASPNPPVGAVIVRDGVVVGEGWTQPPGGDHAEIVALKQAGEKATGAVLYTTLEPCNHHGRTPPCTQAIIDAHITQVHASMRDPNPAVVGGGLARLEEAGIATKTGELQAETRQLLEAYRKFVVAGVPFVTAKFAMSLDGKVATSTGDSKWITGDRARWFVHQLRYESDAIMVGINTVIVDDPKLTARDERGAPQDRQPVRVVVDSRGRIPPRSRLLAEPGKTLIATCGIDSEIIDRLSGDRVDVEVVPGTGGAVDLVALMRYLAGERDITSLLVEGGGTLLGSLFDQGLVDKVIALVAPMIIGGWQAPSPVAGVGVERITDALRLKRVKWRRFGRDMAIIGYC